MQRLLMGEVGSGKTVVALYAMLRAVEHGAQAALMAPTETLAEQHFATIQRLLGGEPVACALLTGSTPARTARATSLGKLASGELSLRRRHARADRAATSRSARWRWRSSTSSTASACASARRWTPRATPHMLHMTATPIPRTLALAGYGDLDASALRELPARAPADRHAHRRRRARARARLRRAARAAAAPGARRSSSAR